MAAQDQSGKRIDQAAAVCYRHVGGSVEFKLVRTTKGGHWVFPKGHIEKSEPPWITAQREALEEAGVRGSVEPTPLLIFPHEKHKQSGQRVELTIAAYLLHVESENDTPEPGRDPTWFPPDQARQKLAQGRAPRYQQAYARLIDDACKKLECRG